MPRQKHKYNERLDLGYSPDGKRIRKWIRADTKPELEALKRAAQKEYETIRNPSVITFGAYADKWYQIYKSRKSQSTQEMYLNVISKFDDIRLQQLRNVTASDLQSIINTNLEHVRICEQIKLTLKQIYKQAIKDGIIYPLNIAEDLELPQPVKKEMRFISDEEMKMIVSCDLDPLDRSYMELLRNTGVRPSEGLALKWSDIDLKEKVIHIQRAFEYKNNQPIVKATKTKVCRDIPINESFAQYLGSLPRSGEYVFLWNGLPFTLSAYNAMSRRILKNAYLAFGKEHDKENKKKDPADKKPYSIYSLAMNIIIGTFGKVPEHQKEKILSLGYTDDEYSEAQGIADNASGLTMYSFRHTYATFLYYNGVKPGLISTKKAAQIMGHSEQIFLSRYTHIDDSKESLAEIIKKLKI